MNRHAGLSMEALTHCQSFPRECFSFTVLLLPSFAFSTADESDDQKPGRQAQPRCPSAYKLSSGLSRASGFLPGQSSPCIAQMLYRQCCVHSAIRSVRPHTAHDSQSTNAMAVTRVVSCLVYICGWTPELANGTCVGLQSSNIACVDNWKARNQHPASCLLA